jgi:hypothetical protein
MGGRRVMCLKQFVEERHAYVLAYKEGEKI